MVLRLYRLTARIWGSTAVSVTLSDTVDVMMLIWYVPAHWVFLKSGCVLNRLLIRLGFNVNKANCFTRTRGLYLYSLYLTDSFIKPCACGAMCVCHGWLFTFSVVMALRRVADIETLAAFIGLPARLCSALWDTVAMATARVFLLFSPSSPSLF